MKEAVYEKLIYYMKKELKDEIIKEILPKMTREIKNDIMDSIERQRELSKAYYGK